MIRASAGARHGLHATLTLALGVLFALVAGEVAVRVWRGRLLSWSSPRHDMLRLLRSAYPAVHDPLLGWAPRPGFRGQDNAWGTRVTIDARGLRAHAAVVPDEGARLLALGDSFTFGDEVDDDDTWPARLERRLGRRVWNAGVFGYGLDQMVLRAERLLDAHAFSGVVLAFVPDDIERCGYSYRYAAKPYFDLVDGRLALRNVPVPEPPERLPAPGLLARSHLVDFVMLRLMRARWLSGATDLVVAHRRESEVAALLVERLRQRCAREGLPLLLVALGESPHPTRPSQRLLRQARARGVATLDLIEPLLVELARDPARRAELFRPGSHFSPEGNAWAAERIATALERPAP